MSLTPPGAIPESSPQQASPMAPVDLPTALDTPHPNQNKRAMALRRLWRALFAVFALEIGLFLLVYPWMDQWNLNHLPAQFRSMFMNLNLEDVWDDPYFRGAVSGLGLINLWIALHQAVRVIKPVTKL